MSIFYDNFVALCAKFNKSPSKVARDIGLSNAAATGWKNGKQPSEVTLAKLANYFSVSVAELTTKPAEKEKTSTETTMGESKKALIDLCLTLNDDEAESMLKLIEVALSAVRSNKNG